MGANGDIVLLGEVSSPVHKMPMAAGNFFKKAKNLIL